MFEKKRKTRILVASLQEESGVILILLALLALVIVSFAAIIIDLSAYANQREQAEEYARLAALAALEAHMGAAATAPLNQRIQAAEDRANTVSNLNVLITERNNGARVFAPILNPTLPTTGRGAQLIPGTWYPSAPPSGNPCTTYPCFVALTSLTPVPPATTVPQVTAYQVRGQIYDQFSTKLARTIFNTASFPVNVLATATVVPRRGVFIVDLSASQTRDTHVLRHTGVSPTPIPTPNQSTNPLGGHGSEFAYSLSTDNPGEPNFQDDYWTFLVGRPDRPQTAGSDTDVTSWRYFFKNYAAAPDKNKDISTITEDQYRKMHFKNDYVQKYVLADGDYARLRAVYQSQAANANYPFPHENPATDPNFRIASSSTLAYRHKIRVDKFRNGPDADGSSFTYKGPEPLQSVFGGLNSAMNVFKTRKVAGDKASLMFVDSRIWYTRFVTMTDNFDYLLRLTDFSRNAGMTADDIADYGDPLNANYNNIITSSTTGMELAVRHGLVPMGMGASMTNLSLAVNQALFELQRDNPTGFSSNFITIITDGLANCRLCRPTDNCTGGQAYACSNQYSYFQDAMNDLIAMVRDRIQGRNVSVNWIMFGDAIAPHMLNIRKDASGTCATDEDARANNWTMVQGNTGDMNAAFSGMSATSPFYQANVAPYQIAVATKGLFGPIRPPLAGCNPATPPTCSGDPATPSSWQPVRNDPFCRTVSQQITAYMQRIIGDNPFTLVEVQ